MKSFIIILVIVFCCLSLVVAEENFTFGNETVYNKSSSGAEFECYESQFSYVHDKQGFVIYGLDKYYNTCERDLKNSTQLLFPTRILYIYSCVDGEPTTTTVNCEFDCLHGTCLLSEELPTYKSECIDNDGGNDIFKRGYTTSEYGRNWDVCVNQNLAEVPRCVGSRCFLAEYTCDNHKKDIIKERVKCDYGCTAGACFECDGCVLGDTCHPYTSLINDTFCNSSYEWENLFPIESTCTDSYQCDTQFCRDGTCFIDCNGCWYDRECLAFDTVRDNMYCQRDTYSMTNLKYIGDDCEWDSECETEQCHKNICRPFCKGCYTPEWDCKSVSLRFRDQYCGIDKEMHFLKEYGDFCVEDYECGDGYCDKLCRKYTLWNRMMTWARNLF